MPDFLDPSSVRISWSFEGQGPDRSQCDGGSHRVEDARLSLDGPIRSAEQSSFSMSGFG